MPCPPQCRLPTLTLFFLSSVFGPGRPFFSFVDYPKQTNKQTNRCCTAAVEVRLKNLYRYNLAAPA